MNLGDLIIKDEIIRSWNNTIISKAKVAYPRNISELKRILNFIKREKLKYLIRTGSCSYDSKSTNPDYNCIIISLKNFNKIININKKRGFIKVQAGALISNLIKLLKEKKVTLFSVPGGEKISIGGAISANTIGKDSTPSMSSFGDSVVSLEVLSKNGKIEKKSNFKKLIGAFGMEGIILNAVLKIKPIKSENVVSNTKILKSFCEIEKDFKKKSEYHYVQVDPFFRRENFAISFRADYSNYSFKTYKNKNLKIYKIDKLIFKFLGIFINRLTWRFFYKFFFLLNEKNNGIIDIHNYHYNSKFKHLIPLTSKKGFLDYEILIKKNFVENMEKIKQVLVKHKIYPMYIIVKKVFKSKNKFYYQFNDNGYAVAICLNKSIVQSFKLKIFRRFLNKIKFKLNLSKTDENFINFKKDNDNLFLSSYKKMIIKYYGISRERTRNF